ncbi:MAG: hypothetical protein CSA95_05735 [Bacteroidetes bacterium]|nr:MAG: hypothetical protein CSA95_05735 [Bacteroidota bacterium]
MISLSDCIALFTTFMAGFRLASLAYHHENTISFQRTHAVAPPQEQSGRGSASNTRFAPGT